jgi:hypothetical protein
MPKYVAEMTPGRGNCAARWLIVTKLYLNSLAEVPKYWAQINPYSTDCYSNPIEISRIFQLPNITDWWHLQEETPSMYADLSNVARAIFSIIPHDIGVEASFSLRRDVIG